PPGDVDALRRHLDELTTDEPARRALGEAAARRAKEQFGWREIGRRYRELFENVTADFGAPIR
ncbi:MAG: glycosyltransferase, partial [bacterium]